MKLWTGHLKYYGYRHFVVLWRLHRSMYFRSFFLTESGCVSNWLSQQDNTLRYNNQLLQTTLECKGTSYSCSCPHHFLSLSFTLIIIPPFHIAFLHIILALQSLWEYWFSRLRSFIHLIFSIYILLSPTVP